jgi:hypothetical protein
LKKIYFTLHEEPENFPTLPAPMAPHARFVLFYARFILPFAVFYEVISFKIKNQEKTENPFNVNVNRVGKLKFRQ